MRRRLIRLAQRAGLILFGLGLTLILLELGVRALWDWFGLLSSSQQIDPACQPVEAVLLRPGQDFTGFYRFDAVIARRWVPGVRGIVATTADGTPIVYAANAHGWRDLPRTSEKPPGTFRIAFVGDSFGLAYQRPLEGAIPRQLEAWLNTQGLAQQVEVLNFSLEGSNPADYSLIVRHEAPRFAPDLIVVQLFLFNDVRADLPAQVIEQDGRLTYSAAVWAGLRAEYEAATAGPGGPLTWDDLARARAEGRLRVVQAAPDGTRSYEIVLAEPYLNAPPELQLHCWLNRISRLYTLLKNRLVPLLAEAPTKADALVEGMIIYEAPPRPAVEAAWTLFENLLVQIAGDAADQGVPIVFVALANADQLYPALFANGLARVGADPARYDPAYPLQRLNDLCADHNLTCWAMLPAFAQAAAARDTLLFESFDPQDDRAWYWGHYTAEGDRLAAQFIGEQLIAGGWLSERE